MKAEVVMNHDMERKLQQHSDEIVKLIKDVKFKVAHDCCTKEKKVFNFPW